jgi:hypothetical protein
VTLANVASLITTLENGDIGGGRETEMRSKIRSDSLALQQLLLNGCHFRMKTFFSGAAVGFEACRSAIY